MKVCATVVAQHMLFKIVITKLKKTNEKEREINKKEVNQFSDFIFSFDFNYASSKGCSDYYKYCVHSVYKNLDYIVNSSFVRSTNRCACYLN